MGLFDTFYSNMNDHTDENGQFSTYQHNENVFGKVKQQRTETKSDLGGIISTLDEKIKALNSASQPTKDEQDANDLSEQELAGESVYKATRFDVLRERIFFGVMAVFIIGFILFFNHQLNKKNESLLSVIKNGQFKLSDGAKKVNDKLKGVDVKKIADKAKEVAKNAS